MAPRLGHARLDWAWSAALWRGAALILALCSAHTTAAEEDNPTVLRFRDVDIRLPDLVQAISGEMATPVLGEDASGHVTSVAGRAIFLPRDPTAGCDAVLEDAGELVDGGTVAWVAVVLPRCPSRLLLDLLRMYRPSAVWPGPEPSGMLSGRSRNLTEVGRYPEMAAIVCAHPVWNMTEPNQTWPIPVIILADEASTAQVALIAAQMGNATTFNTSATVEITPPRYEPVPANRAYAKTVVFVAFCIMSFCIMTMYCRIKVGTMQIDMRNQLWIMALAEASQQYSAEELQLRRQLAAILICSMPTRVLGAAGTDEENPDPDTTTTTATPADDNDDEEKDCCVVCLDPYADGDELRQLPCKHEFHVKCIDPWLISNYNCPLCKYDILEEDPPMRLLDETEMTEIPEMTDMAALPASEPEVVAGATEPGTGQRSAASLDRVEPGEDAELLPPGGPNFGEEEEGGRFGFPDPSNADGYLAVGATTTAVTSTSAAERDPPAVGTPGPRSDAAM